MVPEVQTWDTRNVTYTLSKVHRLQHDVSAHPLGTGTDTDTGTSIPKVGSQFRISFLI